MSLGGSTGAADAVVEVRGSEVALKVENCSAETEDALVKHLQESEADGKKVQINLEVDNKSPSLPGAGLTRSLELATRTQVGWLPEPLPLPFVACSCSLSCFVRELRRINTHCFLYLARNTSNRAQIKKNRLSNDGCTQRFVGAAVRSQVPQFEERKHRFPIIVLRNHKRESTVEEDEYFGRFHGVLGLFETEVGFIGITCSDEADEEGAEIAGTC
ncbi:hypothetical protein DFH08DRAFT_827732 [Mycena albidolilacea]|uniref:Uncharacterized protein n=1 Tax=Mycena albidolilacea TaxID=1033008 RepID=A0AAD6YXI9_9AGAR|nr:hypothetical protein DFH08DRAFT_827732 [Mycena albidolilacea]